MRTHTITHRGITTAYNEVGTGEPPFVLVHGFTGGKLDFENQLPWFADERRVIAPDQRGHGESTNVGRADGYGIAIQSADLRSFFDRLGIRRLHLLGHSMGGLVAMRFALDHPEYLVSLVLMDTSATPISLGSKQDRMAFAERVRSQGFDAMIERQRASVSLPGVQPGIDFLGEEEHWRRIRWKLDRMDREAFVGLMAGMGDNDVLGELGRIRCKTTVLVGEHDAPFIEPSARMAEAIPEARLVTIPGAAHCPQYENAMAWRAAIDAHLEWSSA